MTPLLWMQYAQDTEVLMHGLFMLESSGGEGGNANNDLHQLQQIQAKKEALESSTGILELALGEFPGCALLHLYYLECLADYVYQCESEGLHHKVTNTRGGERDEDERQTSKIKLVESFRTAWQCIGRGNHVNEGMIVSEICRLQGSFLLFCLFLLTSETKTTNASDISDSMDTDGNNEEEAFNILQQISNLFTRWSQTPMGEGSNDEMVPDMEWMWEEAASCILSFANGKQPNHRQQLQQQLGKQKEELWASIDANRRATSSLTNILSSYENDIDVAMSNEGIMFPHSLLQEAIMVEPSADVIDDTASHGQHFQSLKRNMSKWYPIFLGDNAETTNIRYLFGLGGGLTSHAFAKYANFLQRAYQNSIQKKNKSGDSDPLQDHMATHNYSMIMYLYERALSECPTVESLWSSYIQFLKEEWIRIRDHLQQPEFKITLEQQLELQERQQALKSALKTVPQRAVRNCPYSSSLFELQMTTLGLTATSNLEPDEISAVVQEATQMGFLTNNRDAMLHLRLVAITVVKRRLLSLISTGSTSSMSRSSEASGKDYDQHEEINLLPANAKGNKKAQSTFYKALSPAIMDEVQDLIEDVRDMYDEADTFLFQSHPSWVEGKVLFWKHRATSEAYVLGPIGLALKNALDDDEDTNNAGDKETLRCFDKLVKAQKPSHPDVWREYLRYFSTTHLSFLDGAYSQLSPDTIAAVPSIIRKTRGLYNKAIASVRKAGAVATDASPPASTPSSTWFGTGMHSAMFQREYDVALSDLCREFLDFERSFGSEESLSHALGLVRGKMSTWNTKTTSAAATPAAEENGKRKLDTEHHEEEPADAGENQSKSKRTKLKTDLKEPRKTDNVHKVRVGKMDYPAHPFTIHVSNLDKETQDMDLVDVLKREFGPVVHAKILREKQYGKGGHHSHGESKGSGLVQFEERMSVEKALEKSGELEIGGKSVKIQRSHLPAIGVVPVGMHRVNPKGQGKTSKRNQLKKKAKPDAMECEDDGKGQEMNTEATAGGEKMNGNAGHNDGASQKKNKYRTSSSPGSIKLDSLSFKPRSVKQKPKIVLDKSKK